VAKRLENGKFSWPAIDNGVMRLSAAQLQALLEGLDWRRVHEARRTTVPAAASKSRAASLPSKTIASRSAA
jgi:transposase